MLPLIRIRIWSVGVDVRTVVWSHFSQIYLFPPVPLLDLLLSKIVYGEEVLS